MNKSAVPSPLLKKLALGPAQIAKAWKAASPRLRAFREAPGKWSMQEVLVHLLDVEIALGWRLRHIAGDDDPRIVPFDQDKWATRLAYESMDPKACLAAYAALRAVTVDLAKRLTKDQLAREALHPEYGSISVSWILERFAKHDAAHVEQMERARKAFAAFARPKRRRA